MKKEFFEAFDRELTTKKGIIGPFGYNCLVSSALLISILSVTISIIPWYLAWFMVMNGGIFDAGSSTVITTIVNRYYYINDVMADRPLPPSNYTYPEPITEADKWGSNETMTYYVGGYRGWEYVAGWDIDHSEENAWRKYPFDDIHVYYGDRLVWRNRDGWSLDDDLWLVPKEIYDSCDFTTNDGIYDSYYMDDRGRDYNPESQFLLFEAGDVYTNTSGQDSNITWDDFDAWNQFVWDIQDNSHLLPCDEDDLWCQLVTADVLYFVSMYKWNGKVLSGNCKGNYWEDGGAGLKQKVIIEREASIFDQSMMRESYWWHIHDHPAIVDLEYSMGNLARTMTLMHFSDEQRIRSEGHSGLTHVRGYYDGEAYYDDGTYSNGAVAEMHDHPDNLRVIGMGQIQAVLNGVEFTTRHNDYNLNMPHLSSSEYGATEEIPFPDVPPEVNNQSTFAEQIAEMQEWFRAFKTQNKSHRNYTEYFKPVLCYLEGTWIVDSNDTLEEPFESDRHWFHTDSWKQLQDRYRWMANSGRKDTAENGAHLPSAIRYLKDDIYPTISNWEYRIVCHPLDHDVPLSRFRVVDDLHVQLMGSPLTREAMEMSPRSRFQMSTYINPYDVHDDVIWERGRKSWNYLDYLMEQIPGKDNYMADINDTMPDGSEKVIHYVTDEVVNAGYYTRFYGVDELDASGSSQHRKGFADRYLYTAKTTQNKVSAVKFNFEIENNDSTVSYYPTVSKYSYAIPLEIIYLTPLTKWNPYDLEYYDESEFDYSRHGDCTTDDAFYGWTRDNAYFTPAAFFNDRTDITVCALRGRKKKRRVIASGHWIITPEIGGGVGYVRQRYPIFPIHTDGYPAWKEAKAMEAVALPDDYDDPDTGIAFFRNDTDLTYGFVVTLQGGSHQHDIYISGYQVTSHWWDSENSEYFNGANYTITVQTETGNGHDHTLSIYRWRNDPDSEWNYEIDTCRWGSISDSNSYSEEDYMHAECQDFHSMIVRY